MSHPHSDPSGSLLLPLVHLQVLQVFRLQVSEEEGWWSAGVDVHFNLLETNIT